MTSRGVALLPGRRAVLCSLPAATPALTCRPIQTPFARVRTAGEPWELFLDAVLSNNKLLSILIISN